MEVVALGPDSVLREAARAKVEAGGRYSLRGLVPGRYRLVVRGTDGAAVAVKPAFATVRLEVVVTGVDFLLVP